MELALYGDLKGSFQQQPLNPKELFDAVYQTLLAAQHLRFQGIAHRDIKPKNTLVISRNPINLKISDFGLAKYYGKGFAPLVTNAGTDPYKAPEIFTNDPHDFKVDVWSIGIMALEIGYNFKTRERKNCTQEDWVKKVREFALEKQKEGGALINIIADRMVRVDPRDRWSASQCLLALQIKRDEIIPPTASLPGASEGTQSDTPTPGLHENTVHPVPGPQLPLTPPEDDTVSNKRRKLDQEWVPMTAFMGYMPQEVSLIDHV